MNYQKYDFGDGKMVHAQPHPNGGGMVAKTAQVDPTVYVGSGCTVSGYARIKDRVKIVGNCHIVGDEAIGGVGMLIEDSVVISGNVLIKGRPLLRDRAEIRDNVKIIGPVQIIHRARVTGDSVVEGNITIMEEACVTGQSSLISPERATIIKGAHYLNNQTIEYVVREDKQRKRRVTALRPVVLDAQPMRE